MKIEDRVREAVAERVEHVVPPPPDVRKIVGEPSRSRGVRLVAYPVAAAALMGGALGGAEVIGGDDAGSAQAESLGQFDFSAGLRSYMSPDSGGDIHIAGRRFDARKLDDIDTQAAATAFGMVFFNGDGQAHLLDEAGYRKPIGPVPDKVPEPDDGPRERVELTGPATGDPDRLRSTTHTSPSKAFRPAAKADAARPLAAWTEYYGDHVTVRMYDLAHRETVGAYDLPCPGGCEDVEVDAVDAGIAYVSTGDGTYAWEPSADGKAWTRIAGAGTEIVDVRGNTVLYTGEPPVLPERFDDSWRMVEAPAVDTQLTHSGKHVVGWSPTLRPTTPGGEPVTLDLPGPVHQTVVDTDGSVLVATRIGPNADRIYDCDVPSGSCTKLGDVPTEQGDAILLGNDM